MVYLARIFAVHPRASLMSESLEDAHDEARARLGLEPGRFGGHDEVGIGHIEQLLDRAWV